MIRLPDKIVRLLLGAVWLITTPAIANEVDTQTTRAADFTLIDQHGKAFNLHYHIQRPAIVLMAYNNNSTWVQQSLDALQQSSSMTDQDIPLALLAADGVGNPGAVAASVLQDDAGLVTTTLGLRYAGETLVISPRRWEIVYRGPALAEDGNLNPALEQVLNSMLEAQTPAPVHQSMPALAATLSLAPPPTDVSYHNTIAPMLMEKCAGCHRPGGIAPWAMTSHAVVQGFSPMIRETVLTRRMPPWHADPSVGEFLHDLSLSVEQKQQLIAWIDAGAPRGNGDDPLASVDTQLTAWEFGEPDLVVSLPEFDIPATGALDYQFFEVRNPLDRDIWVKAVQIVPGDRQVVHHAIATFGAPSNTAGRTDIGESLFQPQLMTFVPGNDTYVYPENTGVFIPAGSSFYTQMHYTPYGRETRDQTRIGLYFSDKEPEHVLQHYAMVNVDLEIPAGAAEHQEGAYYTFSRDSVIYALFPHAHYRGRASEFVLRYPDGREERVLSVPDYDFNWQRYFRFKQPITAPAGTQVIHRTTYDNSSSNLSNPDADVVVRFGEQTWEEMLYGGISFRYVDRRENDHEIDAEAYFTSLAMGFMDRNMDQKVALDEMPERSRQALLLPFTMLDKDKTGGLEYAEFQQFLIQTGMMGNTELVQ
jgi:hypothetical protein